MVRCFIAINLPSEIRDRILGISEKLKLDGIRPVKSENLHITLKFLGGLNEGEIEEIKQKLHTISFGSFVLPIQGVGVFPNENYIHVIWVGCQSDALKKLADQIENLFGKSDKPFTEHLTIARVTRKIDIKNFLEENKNLRIGEVQIDSFDLMKSDLTPNGPIYTKLCSFPCNPRT